MTISEALKTNPKYIRRACWDSMANGHEFTVALAVKDDSLYFWYSNKQNNYESTNADEYETYIPDLVATDWEILDS
jgi:hypothetical protein